MLKVVGGREGDTVFIINIQYHFLIKIVCVSANVCMCVSIAVKRLERCVVIGRGSQRRKNF